MPCSPGVPGPPGVIRVEDIGDTWVKLQWTKGAEHNSPILYYTIQTRHYWALNEDDWKNASTCESACCGCFTPAAQRCDSLFFFPHLAPSVLDGSVERAEVTDLYSWLEYQFRIIATNEYGSGEASIPSLKIKTWDSGKKRVHRLVLLIGFEKKQTTKTLASQKLPGFLSSCGFTDGHLWLWR